MDHNHHGGRFMDGLLLGAILGGAAVFLLGTKKGNKILKALTEEGMDGLNNFIENLENNKQGVTPKPKEVPSEVEEKITLESPKPNGANNHHSSSKRFFRRAK